MAEKTVLEDWELHAMTIQQLHEDKYEALVARAAVIIEMLTVTVCEMERHLTPEQQETVRENIQAARNGGTEGFHEHLSTIQRERASKDTQ